MQFSLFVIFTHESEEGAIRRELRLTGFVLAKRDLPRDTGSHLNHPYLILDSPASFVIIFSKFGRFVIALRGAHISDTFAVCRERNPGNAAHGRDIQTGQDNRGS
jgi:hypothetical protein